MTPVPVEKLQNHIIKPGFEKHLKPLIMYRGNVTLGQAHRMWNLMVSSMEQDCAISDITQRLQHNSEFSHLCGPEKVKPMVAISSFIGRMLDNPKVMQENLHLEEYVRGLLPPYKIISQLTRVTETTYRARNMGAGGWRRLGKREKHLTGGNIKQAERAIVYPFLIHDAGKPEHLLLRKVNAAVPKYLDPEMRADICQDLMVGLLCGDFTEDDLHLPVKEITKRVRKFYPSKYDISLDDVVPGTDDLRLIDRITEEDSLWANL